MNLLTQGLAISLMGLLLTFTSLGVLILTIVVLKRLFSPAPVVAANDAPVRADEDLAGPELAAVIAAAVAIAQARPGGAAHLGENLKRARVVGGRARYRQPHRSLTPPAMEGRTHEPLARRPPDDAEARRPSL